MSGQAQLCGNVGANAGLFTLAAAALAGASGVVRAVDLTLGLAAPLISVPDFSVVLARAARIDSVKIDVEGSEADVLLVMSKILEHL